MLGANCFGNFKKVDCFAAHTLNCSNLLFLFIVKVKRLPPSEAVAEATLVQKGVTLILSMNDYLIKCMIMTETEISAVSDFVQKKKIKRRISIISL